VVERGLLRQHPAQELFLLTHGDRGSGSGVAEWMKRIVERSPDDEKSARLLIAATQQIENV
jgi:hypothetical protein